MTITIHEAKTQLSKLIARAEAGVAETFSAQYGFEPLPISLMHARLGGLLPGSRRDPFDHMLAAQAQVEDIPLVTADPVFRALGVGAL